MIGGLLIRAAREHEPVDWVRDIQSGIKGRQRPDLHFRQLSHRHKIRACATIAMLPVRAFVLCSNKKNMRGYSNARAEKRASAQEWFYNFCVRLLLERVTDYVKRRSIRDFGALKQLEVVFSNRGGMRYSQTKAYYDLLRAQARSETTYLTKRVVQWKILHPVLVRTVPHTGNAGVQLADVVTSAFYQAVNAHGQGQWCTDYAKLLAPVLPAEHGRQADYSVALQPTPPWKARLTPEQQRIFAVTAMTSKKKRQAPASVSLGAF